MKFKSLFRQTARWRDVLPAAALTSGLAVAATLWATHPGDSARQRLDLLGNSLAQGLAVLAVEPLQREDRLHLSVIANRLLANPQLRSVAIYDRQDQLFVLTGERGGALHYTQPVTADDAVLGYARITLSAPAPWLSPALWGALLAIVALAPVLAFALTLTAPALWRRWRRLLQPRSGGAPADLAAGHGAAVIAVEEAEPLDAPPPRLVLVVNLYNQLVLAPAVQNGELALARHYAERVAAVHGGSVSQLPGTGLVLDFATAGNDRAFQCVCAGLVLKRLLEGAESQGEYRLSLHSTGRGEALCLQLDDIALADACLLSAMARGPGLVLSREALAEVERPQRLGVEELDSLVLEQLEASSGAVRVRDVAPSHQGLLDRQVARLQPQESAPPPDAAASESTF